MGKSTFVLGNAWAKRVLELPDDDFATIVKAVFAFAVDGEEVPVSGLHKAIVAEMTDFLAENAEKYEEVCRKRREAGSLGGKQKVANAKQMVANGSKWVANDSKAKQTAYDNDNEYEYDNDNDTDTDISEKRVSNDTRKETAQDHARKRAEDVQRVVKAWNTLPNVPAVKGIDPTLARFKMLKARLEKNGVDAVLEAIENVRRSSFLQGDNNRGWKIDFTWFVKPNNFVKVLDGNYNDSAKQGNGAKQDAQPRAFAAIDQMEWGD